MIIIVHKKNDKSHVLFLHDIGNDTSCSHLKPFFFLGKHT